MNLRKIRKFNKLLRLQAERGEKAINKLKRLKISRKDGYCLNNLYREWAQAFSYKPGRVEALKPILDLSEKILQYGSDDVSRMFGEPEWLELVRLSGPADVVYECECWQCDHRFIKMGVSGFLDIIGLVCRRCGNVYFKSTYDDSGTPACTCGNRYTSVQIDGCPVCGEKEIEVVSEISPFEYFSSHQYERGPNP